MTLNKSKRSLEDETATTTTTTTTAANGSSTTSASSLSTATSPAKRKDNIQQQKGKRVASAGETIDYDEGMGEFEDAWIDEVENDEDDGDVIVGADSDDEEGMEVDGEQQQQDDDEEQEQQEDVRVYLPGQELAEGEVLVADNSVYEMLHQMQVEWPCLSFDILRDNLGTGRKTFPMTTYIAAGSQAEKAKDNKIYVMKMSELHRTKHDNDDDMDEDSGDEDLDEDPILESRTVPHNGGVNRLRAMTHPESHVVATWSEVGKVYIWDLTTVVASLDTPGLTAPKDLKPIYSVDRHGRSEGFAMDWTSLNGNYKLLTGDIAHKIYLTTQASGGFQTDSRAFVGHEGSIEDLQWSPQEDTVFASASSDKTIKIWDTRAGNKPQISFVAHDSDVNVITWNRLSDSLLASGSDSGDFSVWDLSFVAQCRQSNQLPTPAATFKWHQKPITSIEWHPTESSMLAVAGADDQVTLWDLALERDAEEDPVVAKGPNGNDVEVPPQLLFIHQGQEDVKEVHWHRQVPGVLVSTALSGFNIFKTINS
ncbi:ribosome biosynthesis protein rrb1 [Blyttiomyces sp. JEL0837]|nr:ribosome biosynthesis protein rrb1 [Blyttiomyces sp. JEL0837]